MTLYKYIYRYFDLIFYNCQNYMKPVIERLGWGRGSGTLPCTVLHSMGRFWIWVAQSTGNLLNFQKIKFWKFNFHFFDGSGSKNQTKVALSEVSKTQSCLVFLDFLPGIVRKSVVRYFYQNILLLPVLLSYLDPKSTYWMQNCAGSNKSRAAPPPQPIISITGFI